MPTKHGHIKRVLRMCIDEPRTESELLFVEYLRTNGYFDFDFEPRMPGRQRLIDFLVHWNNLELFFEVKERNGSDLVRQPSGFDWADPYGGLRDEIDRARDKFKEYKTNCCSVVIANMGDWDTLLHPEYIFGAMLGDLGLEYPVFLSESDYQPDAARSVFLRRRGKMVGSYRKGLYQNTSIAAVIALAKCNLRNLEFECFREREIQVAERNRGSKLTEDEIALLSWPIHDKWNKGDHDLTYLSIPRVIVCENPGAKYPLPRNIFCGPFDERWAIVDGTLNQVYAGVRTREIY